RAATACCTTARAWAMSRFASWASRSASSSVRPIAFSGQAGASDRGGGVGWAGGGGGSAAARTAAGPRSPALAAATRLTSRRPRAIAVPRAQRLRALAGSVARTTAGRDSLRRGPLPPVLYRMFVSLALIGRVGTILISGHTCLASPWRGPERTREAGTSVSREKNFFPGRFFFSTVPPFPPVHHAIHPPPLS